MLLVIQRQDLSFLFKIIHKFGYSKMLTLSRDNPLILDYLKEGLDTAMLGVWILGPSIKLGVYFKNLLWRNY